MRVGNGIELRQGHVLGLLASFAHTGRKHTRSAHLPEPLHSLASNQIKIKGLLVITFFTPSPPPPIDENAECLQAPKESLWQKYCRNYIEFVNQADIFLLYSVSIFQNKNFTK